MQLIDKFTNWNEEQWHTGFSGLQKWNGFIHMEHSRLHLTPASYQYPDNYSSAKNWHIKDKSKTNSEKHLQQTQSLTKWPALSVILYHIKKIAMILQTLKKLNGLDLNFTVTISDQISQFAIL